MPQCFHDARVSIAHRREVAARADVHHRKLRPRQVLQNWSKDDERPRVVELAVRGIGDDADHFDVTISGPASRMCPPTASPAGNSARASDAETTATSGFPGRRPTRCHGPAAAAAGTDRRSRAHNNTLAWILTVLSSAIIWYRILGTKRITTETPKRFWLIVGVPLFVIYAMRVAFPDGSFDQLNYHLLSAERGLRGVPFTAADFFPSPFQFNPAPEMITGISRYFLGYRLGTIVNYLAMLWAGSILYKLLNGHIRNESLRSFGVLLILLTEQPLFEINNYMVDLLAVPLLLEATLVILNTEETVQRRDVIRVAFLLGAGVALKLTSIAIVLPLILVYGYKLRRSLKITIKHAVLVIVAFFAPIVPYSLFMFRETGSPVFPFYNKILRSPYWPLINWTDPRWGPKSIWEGLLWPILVTFKPERTSELAVYSGRLSLVFIAVLLCLFVRPQQRDRTLCVVILLGLILWTLTAGYVRYAIYLELLGGVVILTVCCRFKGPLRRALIVLPWIILIAQSFLACKYVYSYEWSMRPTIFHNPQAFMAESESILRDHSFRKFLPERERRLFDGVDVWVESNFVTNAVESLSKKDAPIILVCFPYYFETPASLDKFAKTVNDAATKRMYTLAFKKDLSPSLDMLSFRGFEMGKFTGCQRSVLLSEQ